MFSAIDLPFRWQIGGTGLRIGADHVWFLRCNGRHHSLAIAESDTGGLVHFMLEAQTLDDVGLALDAAYRGGFKVMRALGRHTNDQMVSFYSRTPAGFDVEFGQGAIEVDEATWRVSRHDRPSSWGHTRPTH